MHLKRQLHFLTDDKYINEENCLAITNEIVNAKIDYFQLRFKKKNKRTIYNIAKRIYPLLKEQSIPLIINDHIDIALALDCEGVHIGQTDLPYSITQHLLGENKIIGLTINSFAQAMQAKNNNVSYFGIGPVFQSKTKKTGSPLGLKELTKICQLLKHKPCIAIGGINEKNLSQILQAPVFGMAACEALCNNQSIYKTIKKWQTRL